MNRFSFGSNDCLTNFQILLKLFVQIYWMLVSFYVPFRRQNFTISHLQSAFSRYLKFFWVTSISERPNCWNEFGKKVVCFLLIIRRTNSSSTWKKATTFFDWLISRHCLDIKCRRRIHMLLGDAIHFM